MVAWEGILCRMAWQGTVWHGMLRDGLAKHCAGGAPLYQATLACGLFRFFAAVSGGRTAAGYSSNEPHSDRASLKSKGEDDDALPWNPECKISKELLVSASKVARHKNESLHRYLNRVTHLALEQRGVWDI